VAARREDGADDAAAEAEASLSEATRTLSEASTERVAATQRLATLEERARRARDAREERLRLEDRAGNLRRARRAALADAVASEFREARARIGSVLDARPATGPDAGLRDALAVAAVAPLRAPVVVAPDVVTALGGSDAAFERLDVPLVIG
jgi:chromosome segregation ATPase